jgi:hypothetical protein
MYNGDKKNNKILKAMKIKTLKKLHAALFMGGGSIAVIGLMFMVEWCKINQLPMFVVGSVCFILVGICIHLFCIVDRKICLLDVKE